MKKLLGILIVLLVICGVTVFFVGSSLLGSAVKAGIEGYAPKLTGTPVTLASASVSPLSGAGSISGLTVGNPEGFTSPRAIYLGEVALDVDPMSLTSEAVHIERIYISQPEFTYERTLKGGNMEKILENLQAATASDTPPPTEEGEPIKMIIDEVIIENGQVSLGVAGTQISLPLPRIELHSIGKEKGGVTPDEAALEIMQVVLRQVIDVGVDAIKSGKINLGNAVSNEKLQKAGEKVDEAKKAFDSIFGKGDGK